MSSENKQRLAVGLVSGGLDSLLAIRLVQRWGFDILGLHVVIGFEPAQLKHLVLEPDAPFALPGELSQLGCRVETADLRKDFLNLLANPPHGLGSQLNPCIDCKIMMLRCARKKMEECQASFVFTGEVLGQRPMSQRKAAMNLIERESDLNDRLVRPLCGRLLPPSHPERSGLIDRSLLKDIQGRTRARQVELARSLDIANYPTPAGGCLLTDPQFAHRTRDLLDRRRNRILAVSDPLLLSVGRHLVLPDGAKVVIGRHHEENGVIERFAHLGPLVTADEHPGPTALIDGEHTADDRAAAARLTARYGKGRQNAQVKVTCRLPDGRSLTMDVQPGDIPGSRML